MTLTPQEHAAGPLAKAARPRREPKSMLAAGVDPIRVDAASLAELFGWSVSFVHQQNDAGKLPASAKQGARTSWDFRELIRWSAAGMPCRADWEKLNRANHK